MNYSLLGVVHPIWEKHFKYETCASGWLSYKAARVKKAGVWLL